MNSLVSILYKLHFYFAVVAEVFNYFLLCWEFFAFALCFGEMKLNSLTRDLLKVV